MNEQKYSYQEKLVLDALTFRGTLNTNDIIEMKIWQPASIIFSLRSKGVRVKMELREVWAGARVRCIAHYTLEGGYHE